MPAGEIVDPTKDSVNRLWRLFLRIGIPILGVILVVVVVVGVTLHSYHSTKSGILKLTHVILKTEQSRVSQEVMNYLSPATVSSKLVVDMLSHIPTEYESGMFYTYVMSSLRQTKQLQSFYLASEDGNFTMIERVVDKPNEVRVITLKADQQGGQFLEEYATVDGKKISRKSLPANAYDPRDRSWYKQAMQSGKLVWSPPTLMPSKKGLVITASIPYKDRDGKKGVFAVSISLQQLTTFLGSLSISEHAQAIIVDRQKNVIASPGLLLQFGDNEWSPDKNKIDAKYNPVIARAYDQFLVNGVGIRSFKMEKDAIPEKSSLSSAVPPQSIEGNYISITSQLPESVQRWVVLIVIPESDFSHFAVTGGKQNLLFSLLVVALAAAMAGVLIYQGHRMDKLGQRFKYVKNISERENNAIEMIASTPEVFDPRNEALILTEGVCNLVSAKRVSVWHIAEDQKTLICNDLYTIEDGNHAEGVQYSIQEIPDFFEAISETETLQVDDAANDSRIAQFYKLFMRSSETKSVLITPVLGKKGTIGAVIIEDTPHLHSISHIAKIFAGLVAMRFVAAQVQFEEQDPVHGKDVQHVSTSIDKLTDDIQDNLSTLKPEDKTEFLLAPGSARYNNIQFETLDKDEQQGIYPAVSVMNIAFSGYLTSDIEEASKLIAPVKELVVVLQDIAKKYGLFYVKIMGGHLVAVAGCTKEPDVTAPIRLAHAALDMRAACLEMIPGMGAESNFGIGMDVGPAIGTWFGKEPRTFNLWGPTIGMSALMANMATDGGAVQVTQSAYASLRNDFLFRPRGTFYIPKVGISHTFILAGRR
ncbi:cache domain-containing protein [Commensalibacter papalotli (ex Botero et al. 2024)]|uniref:Class 3 (AcyC) (PDB:1AB8) n=1 Tax=Commensalibacter papalotli (ex Botero et al. 2024) TaxID=2972766 RepID=A0ABM9HPX6_9PROT|nr:cache domain-containing protein [Commensalibacter papalotli (ex Botero et al. 2024)]CAI3932203.1 Adenylate cyclase [Commensalibacter papalotli (ex Botero et al. 2024)]CAI3943483.1 Adenylate cyclase [Commensalibacter papalotli (ex Botero et al. 2024)]